MTTEGIEAVFPETRNGGKAAKFFQALGFDLDASHLDPAVDVVTPFEDTHYGTREMLALAREAGFGDVRHVPGSSHAERYFAGRPDGLRPSSGEDLLVATT